MKLTLVVMSLLSLCLTATARAADEPIGLPGLPWGSPPARVREALQNRCAVIAPDRDGDEVCQAYAFGDVVGRLTLVHLEGHGLAAWRFDCPAADTSRLASLITARFGPAPHDGPYQAFWNWPTTAVSLAKRECSVVFATRDGVRRMEEIERDRVARADKETDGGLEPFGKGSGTKRASPR